MRRIIWRRGSVVGVGRYESRRVLESDELRGGESRREAVKRFLVAVDQVRLSTIICQLVFHGGDHGRVPLAVVGVVGRHGGHVRVDDVRRPLGGHGHRSEREDD